MTIGYCTTSAELRGLGVSQTAALQQGCSCVEAMGCSTEPRPRAAPTMAARSFGFPGKVSFIASFGISDQDRKERLRGRELLKGRMVFFTEQRERVVPIRQERSIKFQRTEQVFKSCTAFAALSDLGESQPMAPVRWPAC